MAQTSPDADPSAATAQPDRYRTASERSSPGGRSASEDVRALRLVERSRRCSRLSHPAVAVNYALRVVDEDLIDLDGLEVRQRLLELPGGPLPATWTGLPLQVEIGSEFLNGEASVPDWGWRQLAGTGDGLENDPKWGTVIAAPTGDGTGRWLLMHLSKTDLGWKGWLPWAVTPRPGQSARRRGLRISWPSSWLDVTTPELLGLTVTLRRDGGGALTWDADDRLDVVGWVKDATTGESLPFDPWQAFSGTGDQLSAETVSIDLTVIWLTNDVGRLAPGEYQVTATIASLNLETEPCRLLLRSA